MTMQAKSGRLFKVIFGVGITTFLLVVLLLKMDEPRPVPALEPRFSNDPLRPRLSPLDESLLNVQKVLVERETARAKALSKDGVQIKVSENGAFEVTRPLVAPARVHGAQREPAAVEPPGGGEWSPEEKEMVAEFQSEMQKLRAPATEEK